MRHFFHVYLQFKDEMDKLGLTDLGKKGPRLLKKKYLLEERPISFTIRGVQMLSVRQKKVE